MKQKLSFEVENINIKKDNIFHTFNYELCCVPQ